MLSRTISVEMEYPKAERDDDCLKLLGVVKPLVMVRIETCESS